LKSDTQPAYCTLLAANRESDPAAHRGRALRRIPPGTQTARCGGIIQIPASLYTVMAPLTACSNCLDTALCQLLLRLKSSPERLYSK